MRIVLPVVMSADGRITKGDIAQATKWRSPEDATFFRQLIRDHDALVMGRNTFEAVQPKPTSDKLRLVLTGTPERYKDQQSEGSLEFMQGTPNAVIKHLEDRGFTSILLVGGASVHAAYLQAGLVDEVYLTVEPALFGAGSPLIEGEMDVRLRLLGTKQLNEQGTLLLHYAVES